MVWIASGLVAWSLAHAVPCLDLAWRRRAIDRLGAGPYRGLFSLVILASLVAIVFGWRSTGTQLFYALPAWIVWVSNALMGLAFLFFAASGVATNIKRHVRHPQLFAVIAWSVAHLLANGDSRSVLLFGGMGAWAVTSILLLDRRDGPRVPSPPLPWLVEIKPIVGGVVAFAIVAALHGLLFGVSPLPR